MDSGLTEGDSESDSSSTEQQLIAETRLPAERTQRAFRRRNSFEGSVASGGTFRKSASQSTFEGSVASGGTFRKAAKLADFLQEALDVDELIVDDDENDDNGFSDSIHDLYLAAFQKLAVDEAAYRRHSTGGFEGEFKRNDNKGNPEELEEAARVESQKPEADDVSKPDEAASVATVTTKKSMTKSRSMTKPTMFKPMKQADRQFYESDNSSDSIASSIESSDSCIEKGEKLTKKNTVTAPASLNHRNKLLFYLCLIMVGAVLATISFFLIRFVEPNTMSKIKTI